jgi:hypothetical protein
MSGEQYLDRIWIVQCLCPGRHCIMALIFDRRSMGPEQAVEHLRREVDGRLESREINPWCSICWSEDRHFEAAPTKYHTMAEAEGPIREEQGKQLLANAILSRPGRPRP